MQKQVQGENQEPINAKREPTENRMGTMPVGKLLLNISVPMMVSMLVLALYNIVDSVYVSMLSERALTAVSLAFPVQNLMIAVGTGTGVGIGALLSRSLGEGNRQNAQKAAMNGLFLALLSGIAFLLIGFFAVPAFFRTQTQDEEIIEMGISYLSICSYLSVGLFMQMTFERILQSTGRTFYTMITQCVGAVVNIILDPILIFGLLGFPKLGVAGAAVATVFGQICAMWLAVYFNIKKNHDITLKISGFRPDGYIIGRIYAVGLPSICMVSIASIMTYFVNRILLGFSATAAAVFGVYFKLQSFVFMPVFGLNNGLVPIIAYNYGARRKARILTAFKLGAIYATVIMAAGFLVFQLAPNMLLSFFQASPEMIAIGVPALRAISWSFLLAGFCIICGSVFQALGNGIMSLAVSVARQLVVLLPTAYLLSLTGDLDAIWWAFPIAELMSLGLTVVFLGKINKTTLVPLENPGK